MAFVILLLIIVFIVSLFFLTSYIASVMSGWNHLRKNYKFEGEIRKPGILDRLLAGFIGFMSYTDRLRYKVDESGLYLWVFPLFRPFHPTVLVPWEDIAIDMNGGWPIFKCRLSFSKAPSVVLRLKRKDGEKILKYAPS